jgi:DNA-binding PadR family transcriptional regulator
VEDGCLVSEKKVVGGKARKYYYITALGRSALAEGKVKALDLVDAIK